VVLVDIISAARCHNVLPPALPPQRGSRGLWTPRPPRCNTWVETMVVRTSLCPRSSCTVRISSPSSRRWVAKLWRHSSSHYSSCVDSPDLFSTASLLWANRRNSAVVATPDFGSCHHQTPRQVPDCCLRVDARSARLPTGECSPRAAPERRRPRRAGGPAGSGPLAPLDVPRSCWGIATDRSE